MPEGWTSPTIANILSTPFAVDGVAYITFDIAHGLTITPTLEDCMLTIIRNTNVTDYATDLLRVNTTDATNVNITVHVNTASATPGATATVGLHIAIL